MQNGEKTCLRLQSQEVTEPEQNLGRLVPTSTGLTTRLVCLKGEPAGVPPLCGRQFSWNFSLLTSLYTGGVCIMPPPLPTQPLPPGQGHCSRAQHPLLWRVPESGTALGSTMRTERIAYPLPHGGNHIPDALKASGVMLLHSPGC